MGEKESRGDIESLEGDSTCAELFLSNGINRCLQYSWNRRVQISSGIVNPVATVERFMPNTPIATT